MPHAAALPFEGSPLDRAARTHEAKRDRPDAIDGYRHLLIMRFAILNGLGAALLAMCWGQGWLETLVAADRTYLVRGVFALFLCGLAVTALKVRKLTRALDDARMGRAEGDSWSAAHIDRLRGAPADARAGLEAALRLRLAQRIASPKHIANALVLLGLIGTVLGFMLSLSGVDPQAVSDVSAVPPMVATMIDGMSVALHTTLVGAALNLWLMANYRLLEGGATHLLARLLEMGAQR